jgi:hypothetical protein
MTTREVQIAVTVTLLTAAALLALFCDFIRIRSLRETTKAIPENGESRIAPRKTLVPPLN